MSRTCFLDKGSSIKKQNDDMGIGGSAMSSAKVGIDSPLYISFPFSVAVTYKLSLLSCLCSLAVQRG